MDRYTVINIRQNHEKEILRLISDDKPSETAVSVKAALRTSIYTILPGRRHYEGFLETYIF